MLADVRLLGLPIKGYAALLTAVSLAGFIAGGMINFIHVRNNPGADPYMPRTQPVVIVPIDPTAPDPQQEPKTLPVGNAPEQPALISNIAPGLAPLQDKAVKTVDTHSKAPPSPAKVSARYDSFEACVNEVNRVIFNKKLSEQICTSEKTDDAIQGAAVSTDASGMTGSGMTIGAGSVTIKPQ